MVNSCCIFGCTNRASKESAISFHNIPAIVKHLGENIRQLSERRRREWFARINLKRVNELTSNGWTKVCSKHFICGKPAALQDDQNPDWVPTQHMGYERTREKDGTRVTERYERSKKRQNRQEPLTTQSLLKSAEPDLVVDNEVPEYEPGADPKDEQLATDRQAAETLLLLHGSAPDKTNERNEKPLQRDQASETDINMQRPCHLLHCPHISSLDAEVTSLREENRQLKDALHRRTYTEETFKEDKVVLFYTGLPNLAILMALFRFLAPHISSGPRSATSKFQSMLMCLMRLRLGLPLRILGDLFGISESSASGLCAKMLDVMHVRMMSLIVWPDREHLQATMPLDFIKSFGRKVTVIIDCFELFIETPSSLESRAQTFSSYKHHNTIKFLIGITPQGVVSYISKGWGGRTSDKYLTENSSFLDNLKPGDLVLADRGFDIEESVGLMCARVAIPAFTKGKKQLSPFDVESTRKLAHLRIHVERVIGNIMQKYRILDTTLPITSLKVAENETVTTLDKMVTVCCALVNLCPSVVPMS